MNYVVSAGVAALAATFMLAFEGNRKGNGERSCVKVFSAALLCFYFLRCFAYDSKLIGLTLVVKGYSSLAYPEAGAFSAVTAFIAEWFSLAAAVA
ncbi:MAG: hypothetical protein IJR61_06945, partial [Clostridia bacterium]|nr:hypothetical protein [Clostridia bacterium]